MHVRLRPPLARARLAFLASDPGLLRLRSATAAITILLSTLGVLAVAAKLASQPPVGALFGAIIATFAIITITNPDPAAGRRTTLLMLPAACCTLALAALFSRFSLIGHSLIVAVMVTAILLRRLGPQGIAIGMAAYLSYFFALFLRISAAQLPWLIACLCVGIGINVTIRRLLFPGSPSRLLVRLLRSLQAQAGIVVVALRAAVETSVWRRDRRSRRRLRRRLAAFNRSVSLVEEKLEEASEPARSTMSNTQLVLQIFDFELAIERISVVLTPVLERRRELTPATRAFLLAELDRLAGELAGQRRRSRPASQEPTSGLSDYERRVHNSVRHLCDAWSELLAPEAQPEPVEAPQLDSTSSPPPAERWLDPTRRQAIQVGIATSLAAIAGEAISPQRWYWCVIAAFLIFTGARSRGEILSRGWQRLLGVFGGAVLGSLLAAVLHHNLVVEGVAMPVLLFVGIYLMRISPALLVFCITAMLALLYRILGRSVVGLLELRVLETAVGAAIGIVVAFIVLPQRTRDLAGSHIRTFLDELGELVEMSASRLVGAPGSVDTPAAKSWAVRMAFRDLRDSSLPLTRGWIGITARSEFRFTVRALSACDHYGHRLAWLADRWPDDLADVGIGAACSAAARQVAANLGRLSSWFAGRNLDAIRPSPALDRMEDEAQRLPGDRREHASNALLFLRRIDGSVVAFAERVGLYDPRNSEQVQEFSPYQSELSDGARKN